MNTKEGGAGACRGHLPVQPVLVHQVCSDLLRPLICPEGSNHVPVQVGRRAVLEACLPRAERLVLDFCDYISFCVLSPTLAALALVPTRVLAICTRRNPAHLLAIWTGVTGPRTC